MESAVNTITNDIVNRKKDFSGPQVSTGNTWYRVMDFSYPNQPSRSVRNLRCVLPWPASC